MTVVKNTVKPRWRTVQVRIRHKDWQVENEARCEVDARDDQTVEDILSCIVQNAPTDSEGKVYLVQCIMELLMNDKKHSSLTATLKNAISMQGSPTLQFYLPHNFCKHPLRMYVGVKKVRGE